MPPCPWLSPFLVVRGRSSLVSRRRSLGVVVGVGKDEKWCRAVRHPFYKKGGPLKFFSMICVMEGDGKTLVMT